MSDNEFRPMRGWRTGAGLFAVVVQTPWGTNNGYVALPPGHALNGKDYDEIYDLAPEVDAAAHGGVTYTDDHLTGVESPPGVWWVGFDCAHYGDYAPALDRAPFGGLEGVYRDAAYVSEKCEELAWALVQYQEQSDA